MFGLFQSRKSRIKKKIKEEESFFWKANSYVNFAWAVPWIGLFVLLGIIGLIFG